MSSIISPLQPNLRQRKAEYFQHFQARGFRGYKSPWLPFDPSNRHLVKEGQLILNPLTGVESAVGIGREEKEIHYGKTFLTSTLTAKVPQAGLVWVDFRAEDMDKYLMSNKYAAQYRKFSRAMARLLRTAHQKGAPLISEVSFPLYHETSPENARQIVEEGISFSAILSRSFGRTGNFFSMGLSPQATIGKGNFSGALVEFGATDGEKLFWLDTRLDEVGVMVAEFSSALSKSFGIEYYTWRSVCAELSAAALILGFVHVFDSFERFMPGRILTESVDYQASARNRA